jgi:hypothetical protein
MNVSINVPAILGAMRRHGWGVRATCINCGVNCDTLKKILDGRMPKHLDAWYRLMNGLELKEEEALHGSPVAAPRPRRDVVSRGRPHLQIVKDEKEGTRGGTP